MLLDMNNNIFPFKFSFEIYHNSSESAKDKLPTAALYICVLMKQVRGTAT